MKVIAKSNSITDIFDEKVIEAYWVGNELLNNVADSNFYDLLNERLRKIIGKNPMKWILTKPVLGAKPHHSFHVLDIYTKTGSSRSGLKTSILETINNCLVMWGKVCQNNNLARKQDKKIMVKYNSIIMKNGKLLFGKFAKKELICPFVNPEIGDLVSFHWGNVCEILDNRKIKNLRDWTKFHLDIANKTI